MPSLASMAVLLLIIPPARHNLYATLLQSSRRFPLLFEMRPTRSTGGAAHPARGGVCEPRLLLFPWPPRLGQSAPLESAANAAPWDRTGVVLDRSLRGAIPRPHWE